MSPWVLVLLAVLVLAVLVLATVWVFRRRRALSTEPEPPPEEKPPRRRPRDWKQALHTTLQRLGATGRQRERRYHVPWCMLVGEPGSGQSSLLASAELHRPFGQPDTEDLQAAGWSFWLFDQGVTLDMPGLVDPEDEDWRSLLRYLRGARGQRPIDSLLLTFPATELVGPQALEAARLDEKARILARGLSAIQRELGVQCPVYVLITKADALPGFGGFFRSLPPRFHREMFGWSSPYALQTPYATASVDEAFESLYAQLCLVQTELLAACEVGLHDREALFLFPHELRALAEPVRHVLDSIFKPNIYEARLELRGLYFCGDPEPEVGTSTAKGPPGLRSPAFVTDLLERKVFAESGLAQPTHQRQLRNQRLGKGLRWATALCLLLAPLGLGLSWVRLSKGVPPVTELVLLLNQSPLRPSSERPVLARGMLRDMEEIPFDRVSRPLLPTSWFSGLDGEVDCAMETAFESIILEAFQQELSTRLAPPREVERDGPPALVPAGMDALATLKDFDERLVKLWPVVLAYSQLCDTPPLLSGKKLERVHLLGGELLDAKLGASFLRRSGLYIDGLANARCPEGAALFAPEGLLRERVEVLAHDVTERLFERNPLKLDLERLGDALAAMEAGGGSGGTSPSQMQEVVESIRRTRMDLEQAKGAAWLLEDELGPDFQEALSSLRGVPDLGGLDERHLRALEPDIQKHWETGRVSLRKWLLEARSPITGPFLEYQRGNERLALSPRVLELELLLTRLLGVGVGGSGLGQEPPGTGRLRIQWSPEGLSEALLLVRSSGAIETKGAEALRPQLDASLRTSLVQAQRLERVPFQEEGRPEDTLAAELANLQRVEPQLRELLESTGRLGLDEAGHELRSCLTRQATDLLRRVEVLLEQEALYGPGPRLARWEGEQPAALMAFEARDASDLERYLDAQRHRVTVLAREYAELPVRLLGVVSAGHSPPPLVVRWRELLDELERREKRAPGSSLAALEAFIRSDMMEVSREDCLERLARQPRTSGDFFGERLSVLQRALRQRCKTLKAKVLPKDSSP
jgi:type VI secretion system protein ImpL